MTEEPNAENVDMIAKALVGKFGVQAIDVAITQADHSVDGVHQTWLAVADTLKISERDDDRR